MAFDVDGVLSSDVLSLHPTGEPMRTVNVKDGYALQLSYEIRISCSDYYIGGRTEAVRKTFRRLGDRKYLYGILCENS